MEFYEQFKDIGFVSETVNQRVTRYRKLRGLSQSQLAEKIGMKSSTYSQMERGGSISAQRLVDIAHALNVDANVLLCGEEAAPKTDVLVLGQSGPKLPVPDLITHTAPPEPSFVLTGREENLIRLYRYITNKDRDDVDTLLNERYHKAKYQR